MGVLKKIGKLAKKAYKTTGIGAILPGTGKGAANRAAKAANAYAAEAQAQTKALNEKTKKEQAKAQKLAIRGLRSRRAGSHFNSDSNESGRYGSPTIG